MKAFGMTLGLQDDPEKIRLYREHHQNVWPEVEASLRQVGITLMRIFLLGKRLFMYMETVDEFEASRDFPKYLELDPKCKEWDSLMSTFQEKVKEAGPDEWWAVMDEVYTLEVSPHNAGQ